MKRQLILEDGNVFIGEAFGANLESEGEVVFHTAMTGYQETLSDPACCGQILVFTYPLAGNYGINRDDFESIEPAVGGVVVKEAAAHPSHWKMEGTLNELLQAKNIPGLQGVDTRKLTRHIRKQGTLKGKLRSMEASPEDIIQDLQSKPSARDQVGRVSTKSPYAIPGSTNRVVLLDFGAKKGMLHACIQCDWDVIVVPYNTSFEEILRLNPDGVLLSGGPGNPKEIPEAVGAIRNLLGKLPIFGVGLGHQLLALACGADTQKMKFGHHGGNYPVKDLATGKVEITSQNHGYTVKEASLSGSGLEINHRGMNDGTVEGLRHRDQPVFSIQFDPEASLSAEEANPVYESFKQSMEKECRTVGGCTPGQQRVSKQH